MSPSKTGKDVSMRRCDQIGPAEVMRGTLAWLVEGLGGAEASRAAFRDRDRGFNALSIIGIG